VTDTFVLGVAMHPPSAWVADKRLEEMVFDTAWAALNNANVDRKELDHVTVAASDELDGRSISSMLLSAPAGAYLKDEIKATDSGLIGFCLEVMRIESGRFHLGLVSSWNKSSKAPFEDVMRMRCEPFYTRDIGLNMSIADGFFAQAVSRSYALDQSEVNAAVYASYEQAHLNERGMRSEVPSVEAIANSPYISAPLRKLHQAPITDGCVSMVVCSGEWLRKRPERRALAKVSGLSWQIDDYQLGEKRLSSLQGFKQTFRNALSMSGLQDVSQLDVIEIDSQTSFHHLACRRALEVPTDVKVSPSGGPFAQNPYFCTGLVHAAEAVLQVANQAGSVQVKGATRAAAHGSHGFAQQGNAVAIFEGA
jgi:acetyl-CoA acetyltransferase